ncbi:MAG: hypothetical protein WCO06_02345 [Candidatus Roizmanbacteria bacterium]
MDPDQRIKGYFCPFNEKRAVLIGRLWVLAKNVSLNQGELLNVTNFHNWLQSIHPGVRRYPFEQNKDRTFVLPEVLSAKHFLRPSISYNSWMRYLNALDAGANHITSTNNDQERRAIKQLLQSSLSLLDLCTDIHLIQPNKVILGSNTNQLILTNAGVLVMTHAISNAVNNSNGRPIQVNYDPTTQLLSISNTSKTPISTNINPFKLEIIEMPSTLMHTGLKIASLSAKSSGGRVWIEGQKVPHEEQVLFTFKYQLNADTNNVIQ